MNTETGGGSGTRADDDGIPVCAGCLSPIQPGSNYCAKCGSAVGQYTEYVPFVNIRWQAAGYDRLRRSTWPRSGSVFARVIWIFVTVLLAPILLLGLPFKWLAGRR